MKQNNIKTMVVAGALALVGIVGASMARPAFAVCKCTTDAVTGVKTCVEDDGSTCTPSGTGTLDISQGSQAAQGGGMVSGDLKTIIGNIVRIFMYAVGAVAVIMMILGGFQYVTSSGDQAKVTKAKNTILYGVVGLVVALLAYAIVSFVLTNVK